MHRTAVVIALFFTMVVLFGCSRGHDGMPDASNEPAPGALTDGFVGLPGLEGLPAPERELSMVGPGWFPLVPREVLASSGASAAPPDGLTIDGAVGHAFALYGVYGFDGDNGPTSARITVVDVTGEFYVGFSDYLGGAWSYAGPYSGTATAEIPNTDEYTSPTAFTSEGGVSYVTVLAATGNAVTITELEMGIHGGNLGPAAPTNFHGDGGDAGVHLSWMYSTDILDPDFVGYVLERAPLLWGDYQHIGPPEPMKGDSFLDNTGQMDVRYRYRVAAIDASGNMSIWRNITAKAETGVDTNPVAVLTMPHGPLFGPVDVTFDLSQSYDPMNPGVPSLTIDKYYISFNYGPASYDGADPMPIVTLQPGCYMIKATVEVSGDGRIGSTYRQLVVYPQWQENSTLVNATDPNATRGRLFMPRAARHPASGKVALFAYDYTSMMFDIWYQTGPGRLNLYTLPTYCLLTEQRPVKYIGEPVIYRDSIIAPVTTTEIFFLAKMNDDGPLWIPVKENDDTADQCAAATDGENEVWVFHGNTWVDRRLMVAGMVDGTDEVVDADCVDALKDVAAVYNPVTGLIDVVYTIEDAAKDYIKYVSWDPVNNVVVSQTIPYIVEEASSCGWLDIEYNPVTERAALLYLSYDDNFNHFRELEADGVTWSADVIIDNTSLNGLPELAFGGTDNRAYAAFTVENCLLNTAHIYQRDGGVWSMRNTASYSLDSGHGGALMAVPGSTDLIAVDVDIDGKTYVVTAHGDGTDTLWSWWQFGTDYMPNSNAQGFDMHGAGGNDGLHVVYDTRNEPGFTSHHFTSPDGAVWTDVSLPSVVDVGLDLTATNEGDIYLSGIAFPGFAHLHWWDGALWQNRMTFPTPLGIHRPFLSAQPVEKDVRWAAYDDGTGQMHYVSGNEDDGYTDNAVVLINGPVWSGVIQSALGPWDAQHFDLTGGPDMDDSALGFHSDGSNIFETFLHPYFSEPFFHLLAPETWGRSLDASLYYNSSYFGLPNPVYWAVQGSFFDPIRYEDGYISDPILTQLPTDVTMYDTYRSSTRRTVSAGLAWGLTAVGLMANLDGNDVYFEWSHFGEWEELPMPDLPEYSNNHELIVGMDGRWHIIYKDYLHDRIYCRSSLP